MRHKTKYEFHTTLYGAPSSCRSLKNTGGVTEPIPQAQISSSIDEYKHEKKELLACVQIIEGGLKGTIENRALDGPDVR